MLYLAILLWYIIGVASFIYWWTKEFDFTASELVMAMFSGFMGPVAFIVGSTIHGDCQILLKRRK